MRIGHIGRLRFLVFFECAHKVSYERHLAFNNENELTIKTHVV